MRIDSRILDIPREVLKSIDTGNAGGRQVQHTSEPEGGNTAFFYDGWIVEFGPTQKIFTNPSKKQTEDYITGRFG